MGLFDTCNWVLHGRTRGKVKAVVRDGKVVRREHYRNYGREIKSGLSLHQLLGRSIMSKNGFFDRLKKYAGIDK